MPVDMPPVPPAVIEFAQKNGGENVRINRFWSGKHLYKGYEVYFMDYVEKKRGENFILRNDKEMRFSTIEEWKEISAPVF